MSLSTGILLGLAIVAANLPFLTERIFLVMAPRQGKKHGFWRVPELVMLYIALGGLAYLLESKQGPAHQQGWEFYVVTLCLFMVLGFPGFVYRYLWRKHRV